MNSGNLVAAVLGADLKVIAAVAVIYLINVQYGSFIVL